MKPIPLLTSLALAGTSAIAFGSTTDFGASLVPDEARGPVREIVRSAVRHFLNFRQETPLNADQKAAIGKILQEHRPKIQAQFAKGRDARRAMEAAAKETPASPAAKAAAEKLGEVTRDRALLMARISAQVRPLLTPQQQKQVEAARGEIETLIDQAFAASGR